MVPMKTSFIALRASALLVVCAAAISGCGGSGAKTVTAASSPPGGQTNTSQSTTPSTAATTTDTRASGTSTSSTTTTRTAPEPAFTEQEARAPDSAGAAAAVVRANGFTPNSLSDYHAGQTLRVLVGTRTGSGDGFGQRAFFFLDGRYLGTDTKEPSAKLSVVSQNDTEVVIAYPLYRHSDPLCCPGGGQAVVHFQLNNGKLAALDRIPPANSSTGLSRN